MSASSMPTLAPSAARARARLTAVVDLPTPPLPEATAMMFLTPGISLTPFCTLCATIFQEMLAFAFAAPAPLIASSTIFLMSFMTILAG
jgi:hypothetical protein